MHKPAVIASLHGFKSHGKWQTNLAGTLSTKGFQVFSFDYGYQLLQCLIPGFKKRLIKEFYSQYTRLLNDKNYQIDNNDPNKRISIVAHSLGSYILCNSMLKYPDIKFDKIILCGSIVDEDYKWEMIFRRSQVFYVRNEFSKKDKVVRWGWVLSRSNSGQSGWKGFKNHSSLLVQENFEHFDHGTFFEGGHIGEYWIPFFQKKPPAFQVINGKDITTMDGFVKIFDQTTVIDDDCFGDEPNWKDFAIPDGLAEKWVKANRDIYSFLINFDNDNEVIGYINALPLKAEAFEEILSGKKHDNEIRPEDILEYESEQEPLDIYIMSIALKPAFQNKHLDLNQYGFQMLYNSLIDKLSRCYSSFHTKVKRIAAVGWKDNGIRLCKMMNMKETGMLEEKTGKPIFLIEIDSIDTSKKLNKTLQGLIKLYN